jgi:2-dehydropantoate 2-reductase
VARVVLIGPGAIGGTVAGGLLASGRHDVTVCANQHFETLTIRRADGSQAQSWPVRVATRSSEIGPAEWVLLAVKAHQTPSSEGWLKAAVGPSTKLAILQNGVEHRDRVVPFIPPSARVLPIVVQLPAQRTALGEITTYGGALLIAEDGELGCSFADLFADTPVKVNLTDDFMTAQWEKLCLNAASGSITALTLNPDAIGTTPGLRELALGIVEECMQVGRAEGAHFADGYALRLVDGFMMRTGNRGNSMYYDRREGKELEYDGRNAVICRLGRKHGIATPLSDMIVPLLQAASGRKV